MRRLLPALFVALLVVSATASARMFMMGVQGPVPPPSITGIALSGNTFTIGTASTIGTATVSVSSGTAIPSWSIATGTGCTNFSGHITINSSTGVVSYDGNNSLSAGTNPLCIVDTDSAPGIVNSPFKQAINV